MDARSNTRLSVFAVPFPPRQNRGARRCFRCRQTPAGSAPCGLDLGDRTIVSPSASSRSTAEAHTIGSDRLCGLDRSSISRSRFTPIWAPAAFSGRDNDQSPWSSLEGASPWGPERLDCQGHWVVGSVAGGNDMCFSGSDLSIRHFASQGNRSGWLDPGYEIRRLKKLQTRRRTAFKREAQKSRFTLPKRR